MLYSKSILIHYRDATSKYAAPAYFLAQPTIRSRPTWYLPLLPVVVRSLTGVLRVHNPNLYALPAFISTSSDLDSDGVHFSALSGRDYVLHLLDQSR